MAADRPRRGLSVVLLLLCALVLGASIGLFVGREAWPPFVSDARLSELALDEQLAYVVLVADSYAVSDDALEAQRALSRLTDEDTSWNQIGNLAELTAQYEVSQGRPASAARVYALIDAAGWPSTSLEAYTYAGTERDWTALAVLAGAALLGLIGVALTAPRLARRGVPQSPVFGGEPSVEPVVAELAVVSPTVLEHADGEDKPQEVEAVRDVEEESGADVPESTGPEEVLPSVLATELSEADEQPDGAGGKAGEDGSTYDEILSLIGTYETASTPASDKELDAVQYVVTYEHGQDDLSASFNVENASGAFMGECGVTTAEVLPGRIRPHLVAAELWLFDRNDVQTDVQILCSPWALADEDMRSLLEPRGELVVAQPGVSIKLERLTSEASYVVREVSWGSQADTPEEAWFERLVLDVAVRVKRMPSV